MQIRCPHCQNAIEVVSDETLREVGCPGCGSSFSLVPKDETASRLPAKRTRVGHFEFLERLGIGAHGSVWKALDTELDRHVAIKIPRNQQLSSTEAENFLREARAAAQLSHPHIVSVHEVGREEETYFIVSDLVEGVTLSSWLTARTPAFKESVELCQKVADALEHAHQAGVIHRDLKPSNIMIDSDEQPRLLDFGLAKRQVGEITMTVDGQVLGTPAYMSPEQARGEGHRSDARSDVYSLGVILYELLTGELPFRGNSEMLIYQVLHDESPSPRKLNSRIPRDLETITVRCLQKNPAWRYPTAAHLSADLGRFLEGRPILARPVGDFERTWRWCKRRPAVATLSAAVVLLLLVVAYVGPLAGWRQSILRRQAERALASEEEQRKETEASLLSAQRQVYISEMLLLQRDWENNNIDQARERLRRYAFFDRYAFADQLKGFEWGYWNRLLHSDQLTLGGNNVIVSPVGTTIARTGMRGLVAVCDADSGKELFELPLSPSTEWIKCLAYSPDGQWIGIGFDSGEVKVWRPSSGSLRTHHPGHSESITSICFSPDGRQIASGSHDGFVKVWNAESGLPICTLERRSNFIRSVNFSPDGKLIVVGGHSWVRVCDAESGRWVLSLDGSGDASFSPDGKRIVSCGDVTAGVWDISLPFHEPDELLPSPALAKLAFRLKGGNGRISRVRFSPDGTRIVSGSSLGMVKVWDAETGINRLTLKGHAEEITSLSFSHDGQQIVSGSKDGVVKIWDAGGSQETPTLKGHTHRVNSVVFNPRGNHIISSSDDSTIKVWDVNTRQQLVSFEGHTGHATKVAFSPDRTRVAIGGNDMMLNIWDVDTGQELFTIEGVSEFLDSVCFSPDGKRIVCMAKEVVFYDAETGQKLNKTFAAPFSVNASSFSPDGNRIATATAFSLNIIDADTGLETLSLDALGRVFSSGARAYTQGIPAYRPDGRQIAIGTDIGTVVVWDASTGEEVLTLKGHSQSVTCVSFRPDGRQIVSGSDDGMLKVWDTETGQETLTLKGHTQGITSISFSPDGQRIISGSADNTIKIWDARPLEADMTQ